MAKRNNMPKRWNRRLLPALLLCLACACTNRPKDVLDLRDMTDVLVDIHTLDGVFASTSYSRFQEEERDAYYEAILVRHHITKAQFDSSLLWYSRDPKKFEKVYTRVIDQLTAEEAAVKAGKYHELLPKASTITHMDLWTDSTRFTLRGDSLSRRPLAFSVADTSLVMGDVYEVSFKELAFKVAQDSLEPVTSRMTFEDGSSAEVPFHKSLRSADQLVQEHGRITSIHVIPVDKEAYWQIFLHSRSGGVSNCRKLPIMQSVNPLRGQRQQSRTSIHLSGKS